MQTVIGIDLGTQRLKVVFYDFLSKKMVATQSVKLQLCQDGQGVAEQQSHWWLNALQEAFANVDEDVRQSALSIGVSGQQHGFVALNKAGAVIAPVKLWCDTSTGTECDEIMDAMGGADACL